MDSIGDYIYLILVAVFALSGLLGKKKKPAKAAEKKKSIFDELPKSWEEFEEMIDAPQKQAAPAESTPFPGSGSYSAPKPKTATFTQSVPYGSAEDLYSTENETSRFETMSYDTATDFTALRAKNQIKESVFKNRSTLGDPDSEAENLTNFSTAGISLDSAEEARKAFIYSEIFQRKYS